MSQQPIRRAPRDPEPDFEGEQEVDLARYGWAIVHRWWLVVLAIVVGGVIGYLVSIGGETTFQAEATIYPGQPLTPSSGGQLQSLQTNPSAINQIVRSQSVVRSVAGEVSVDPQVLRGGISTRAVGGNGNNRTNQAQLVEVIVRGPWRRQSAEAANLLAERAVAGISEYPLAKIEQLEGELESIDDQLQTVDASIEEYRAALDDESIGTLSERLLLTNLLNGLRSDRAQLVQNQTATELSLAVARDVEQAQVVTPAAPNRVDAKSRRSAIIVGAVIGLVVGLLAAALWEPVRRRLRPA